MSELGDRPAVWVYVTGAVGMALAIAAVFWLRSETLSVSEPVDPDSRIELVLEARARAGESSQTVAERVEALVLTCRIEVRSDPVLPIERLDDETFRVVFVPSMDRTDRKQFTGCMQDWLIDGVRANVVSLTELPGPRPPPE